MKAVNKVERAPASLLCRFTQLQRRRWVNVWASRVEVASFAASATFHRFDLAEITENTTRATIDVRHIHLETIVQIESDLGA